MRAFIPLALAVVGCGEEGTDSEDPRVDAILSLSPDTANGADIYANAGMCVTCHAADGTGVDPFPSLIEQLAMSDDEQAITAILDGVSGTAMPPYEATFSQQEIADVYGYVLDSFGP